MTYCSRREFFGLTAGGLAGMLGGPWFQSAAAANAQEPDLIVFNAKVYTMDKNAPRVEAFSLSAGRFAAIGATAEIKTLAGKRTQTYDAQQMTIVPGFIDCHNHATGNVLLYEVLVGAFPRL